MVAVCVRKTLLTLCGRCRTQDCATPEPCHQLRSLVPGLRHEVAGQIIIRHALDGNSTDYERPPVRDHTTADHFQELLVECFARIRVQHDGPLVLDGHFVVPTENGPSPIGTDVIRRLCVTSLVLVETDAKVVASRLCERTRPTWWDGRVEAISELALREHQQASAVAESLGSPLLILASGEGSERCAQEVFGVG